MNLTEYENNVSFYVYILISDVTCLFIDILLLCTDISSIKAEISFSFRISYSFKVNKQLTVNLTDQFAIIFQCYM